MSIVNLALVLLLKVVKAVRMTMVEVEYRQLLVVLFFSEGSQSLELDLALLVFLWHLKSKSLFAYCDLYRHSPNTPLLFIQKLYILEESINIES